MSRTLQVDIFNSSMIVIKSKLLSESEIFDILSAAVTRTVRQRLNGPFAPKWVSSHCPLDKIKETLQQMWYGYLYANMQFTLTSADSSIQLHCKLSP